VSVGEPTAYRYGMLWVEDIGCGGIVDDDCVFEFATNLREVLERH